MKSYIVHEIRYGLIKVQISRKKSREKLRHTLSVKRLYRNGERWIESSRFGRDDIPILRKALDDAHTWILLNSMEEPS